MTDIELLAEIMLENGLATGHGDTLGDLLSELQWQLAERREKQKNAPKTYAMHRFNEGVWDTNIGAELITGNDEKSAAESILGISLSTEGEPNQLRCEVWLAYYPEDGAPSPDTIKQFYYLKGAKP